MIVTYESDLDRSIEYIKHYLNNTRVWTKVTRDEDNHQFSVEGFFKETNDHEQINANVETPFLYFINANKDEILIKINPKHYIQLILYKDINPESTRWRYVGYLIQASDRPNMNSEKFPIHFKDSNDFKDLSWEQQMTSLGTDLEEALKLRSIDCWKRKEN